MNKPLLLSLLTVPLLAGCINDAAAYRIDGRHHALSVTREQNFFWEKNVKFSVISARLPDCQRLHALQPAPRTAALELWQPGPGTFILKQGDRYYLTETQTCLGFQKLTAAPLEGMGVKLGVFEEKNDQFVFTAEPKAPAPPEVREAVEVPAEGPVTPAPAATQ